ncbi:MAG: sigma factor-like helix-turn-helix DNA-binding protein [Myxococcota bacterium]
MALADPVIEAFCRRTGRAPTTTGPALENFLNRGRAAWPAVELSDEAVLDFLGAALERQRDPEASLEALHADGLYLACGVAQRNQQALAAFDETYLARVGEYVVRVTTDAELVKETRQKVRELLFVGHGGPPKIHEYSGLGPLGGWVRMVAIRTAMNLGRGAPVPHERVSALGEKGPIAAVDPELALLRAQGREVFQRAFAAALEALSPEDRALLRLHYADNLTMDQLAPMFQTSRSSVARRIDAVRKSIFAATAARLRDEQRLSATEIESLVAGAASQFQLTFSAFIKP